MKILVNLFFLVFFVTVFSNCSSSKELTSLKANHSELQSKLVTLESNIAGLNAEKNKANLETESLKKKVNASNAEKMACEKDLEAISSLYGTSMSKLAKLRTELKTAFPNNLNEQNFSITEEDGRLVITLPNKILYKKGEANFDDQALQVIQKLSKIFRNNQGLQILVEGHTDETPLRAGSIYADNWDLSLARAVKIVRQLETYGVHPARLTAAGRGYFAPKNRMDSDEARAMNRRTEIIIRPIYTDLFSLIDNIN
jgi:chemotaxis protein MotB